MGSLTDQVLGGQSDSKYTVTVNPTNSPPASLADTVLSTPADKVPDAVQQFDLQKDQAKNRAAFVHGLSSVLNTVGQGIGYLDKTFIPGGEQRAQAFNDRVAKENKDYETANPPGSGFNNQDISNFVGQVVATAPLMPVKAFTAVSRFMGALPTVAATGEKIAAPLINRLGAATVTGAAGGAEYGALTSSSNDEGVLANTGKGLIMGALAAPLLTVGSDVAQKALPTVKNLWANVQINKIAKDANMEPAAVKNVLSILQNAGYSPREAQLRLNQMGPQATLADLAQSIQTEASGLASFGGKPTEILKSRYEARAQGANSQAHDIMEQKLGPKPDIELEKSTIIKNAQNEVKPDYQAAYNSGANLDITPVVQNIDAQLKTAVGPKAQALAQIKSYLYNKDGTLKNSVPDLHEIRQAIDDVVDGKNPTTSYGKNAARAITEVRSGIDTALKTVPEFAAADAKFASKMQIVNDIDTGTTLLKKGMNKEEFSRMFDSLTPDRQDAIKKGMRGAIGDAMEQASRGELSEAQRLFGKNSTNRANLEKAFGQNGSDVLDALEKEAMLRSTEQKVIHGAQTAERQAVQRKYGERNDKLGSGFTDILHGAGVDMVSGSPGLATAAMTVKRIGGQAKLILSTNAKDRMIEGTSDLLSRQGQPRNIGLDIANKANKINNLISRSKLPVADLPTYLLSAPIGESSYSAYKKLNSQ